MEIVDNEEDSPACRETRRLKIKPKSHFFSCNITFPTEDFLVLF